MKRRRRNRKSAAGAGRCSSVAERRGWGGVRQRRACVSGACGASGRAVEARAGTVATEGGDAPHGARPDGRRPGSDRHTPPRPSPAPRSRARAAPSAARPPARPRIRRPSGSGAGRSPVERQVAIRSRTRRSVRPGHCGERRQATAAMDPTTTASRIAIPMNRPAEGPAGGRVIEPLPLPRSLSDGSGRSGTRDELPDAFGLPLATGAPDGIGASCGRSSTGPPVGSKSIQP